ncbi:MAG TPA: HigA family addiction module antitoxin [Solirubrobacteraceae bacterium]|jgi:addiction module HigA family antidote
MAISSSTWSPDWAVAPGEILQEALDERGMSQSELARRMDRPVKTINEIVNAKAAITPDTALQLELTLGISASFWNGAEANYREQLARARAKDQLARYTEWADAFPIKALADRGLVDPGSSKIDAVASLLSFFQVTTPRAWETQWLAPSASFRQSPAFAASPHAVAAWLRCGELLAAEIDTAKFDRAEFERVVAEARALTRREPFSIVVERLRKRCAEAGVALVLIPELPKTRLSGAARWQAQNKAILQLSLRHKSDDHFWFSFFHECAHILSPRRRDYVDIDDDALEADDDELNADRFARDTLISPQAFSHFVQTGRLEAEHVRSFARDQHIAPGIVVGRLQRDKLIPYSKLNNLKKSIDWAGLA